MATSPTLDTIRQNYVTYADYEEVGSPSRCKSFITACRQLLVMLPTVSSGVQGTNTEFEIESIRLTMGDAQNWLAANPSASDDQSRPAALHHDFEAFTERT